MEKVFVSDSYVNNCIRAKQLENDGKWEEARSLRIALGHMEDVAAIDMILQATRLGDEYRRLAAPINEDYEARRLNIYEYTARINEVWKQVYGS